MAVATPMPASGTHWASVDVDEPTARVCVFVPAPHPAPPACDDFDLSAARKLVQGTADKGLDLESAAWIRYPDDETVSLVIMQLPKGPYSTQGSGKDQLVADLVSGLSGVTLDGPREETLQLDGRTVISIAVTKEDPATKTPQRSRMYVVFQGDHATSFHFIGPAKAGVDGVATRTMHSLRVTGAPEDDPAFVAGERVGALIGTLFVAAVVVGFALWLGRRAKRQREEAQRAYGYGYGYGQGYGPRPPGSPGWGPPPGPYAPYPYGPPAPTSPHTQPAPTAQPLSTTAATPSGPSPAANAPADGGAGDPPGDGPPRS